MHHALQIQEILSSIFGHCHRRIDQASLARTCRAFKEPALDVLWEEFSRDISPLARCLPVASRPLYLNNRLVRCFITLWIYHSSFSRLYTEWDILRGYTRLIRSIMNIEWGLDEKSLEILSNPPTSEPLFPNLRLLGDIRWHTEPVPLLRSLFPSLVSLHLYFGVVPQRFPQWFQDCHLASLPDSSPNVTELFLVVSEPDVAFCKLVSNWICRWRNIQTVQCNAISLDVHALAHLSRMPAFTELICEQVVAPPDCISPLPSPVCPP
ncbi:hypothetical protein EV363DRAFT_1538942 [Boletus edulis]|nr:hypothetical protein EV363DRAFT_1538942 [Boletus edulis]